MDKVRRASNAAVLPSMADYGLATKEQRGIGHGVADMPELLSPVAATLERFSRRLGVSLSGPAQTVAENVATALSRRPAAAAQPGPDTTPRP